MHIVEIFNVLAQKPDFSTVYDNDGLALRGLARAPDGRILAQRSEKDPLPDGVDLATVRAYEAGINSRPIQDITTFTAVVSYEDAHAVFEDIAGMRKIDYRYIYAGCESRTHLMCAALFDMGIIPGKAWAEEGATRLKSVFPDGSDSFGWSWHVAPTIKVEMPDGNIRDYVIDPGFFDGLATPEEWRDALRAEPDKITLCAYDQGPRDAGFAFNFHTRLDGDIDVHAMKVVAKNNRAAREQNLPDREKFKSGFFAAVGAQLRAQTEIKTVGKDKKDPASSPAA